MSNPAKFEKRIPSLDGLRAIAIILVLVAHLVQNLQTHHGPLPPAILAFAEVGPLGVTIFFVISGFLITSLLLREMEIKGTISLAQFYFRRTFRLLPAYYSLVAFIGLGYLLGAVKTNHWNDIFFHALTYTTNYNSTWFWYLGHTWSLGVEEQFYLLWPAALLLLGKRRGLICIGLLLVICPFVRGYYASLPQQDAVWNLRYRSESAADALAIGCWLAGARPWLQANALFQAFLKSGWVLAAPVWVALSSFLPPLGLLHHLAPTLTILAVAVCVDWAITFPDAFVGRVLNTRPIVFVGVLSYSIYLWQQPFLNPVTQSAISNFPVNVLLVGAAGVLSYYGIERPGLSLRDKLAGKLFAPMCHGSQ